jgi:hypothetical protein
MKDHFDEARVLFELLLRKYRKLDDDEIELEFTCSRTRMQSKDVGVLLHAMDEEQQQPTQDLPPNIQRTLQNIFDRHLNMVNLKKSAGALRSRSVPLGNFGKVNYSFERPKRMVKPATLIFLTDGSWGGKEKWDAIDATIKEFLRELHHEGETKDLERQFTIQFVHFGDDVNAAIHLEHLDDNLGSDGLP